MSEKAKRVTWRDWLGGASDLPDPLMLTRVEVIAAIDRLGIRPKVDERTLRYWETEALIPRPSIAYVDHATRARYPWWVVDLVAQIRLYQSRGFTLDQLRSRMPVEATWLVLHEPRPSGPAPDPEAVEAILAAELGRTEMMPPIGPNSPPFREASPIDLYFAGDLVAGLSRLAWYVEQDYGVHASVAEVHLIAENGDRIPYRVPVEPVPPPGIEEG